jgi:CubicO group peptidase (beta-lactamase class C family)
MNDIKPTAALIQNGLDAVLDKAIADRKIVGGVLSVSLHGQRVYERAVGYADRESQQSTKLDTVFRWASLTKPLMAALTLALTERGVIALEDPVTRFLPEFLPRTADGKTPKITVRHLLTHTAGLTYKLFEKGSDGPYHRANVSDGMDQPGLSIQENLRRIVSAPLAYTPGTSWGYSVSTDVLGEYLARAAATPLPTLMRSLVTEPLGAIDSGFTVSKQDRPRLATAYGDGEHEPVRMGAHHLTPFGEATLSYAPDRMFNPDSYPSGGGGMSGTAQDFMRFLEGVRTGGAPILSKSSFAQLSTVKPGDFEVTIPGWKWALGWPVLVDPSRTGTPQSPGSWLWGGVYGNSWFVDPRRELSVVLLTNTAVAGMVGALPDAIRDAIYRALGG